MITYALIALAIVQGEPMSYVLDYNLTIEDCGRAIVSAPMAVHLHSNEVIRLPALTFFVCEPESTQANFRRALEMDK